MALQKFIHKVSPQLTQDAQFKAYSNIPENQLTPGSTVELYPGTYSNITCANGVAIQGVGSPQDVNIPGIAVSSGTTGNVRVENLTLTAVSNALSVAGSSTAATLHVKNVIFNLSTGGVTPVANANTIQVAGTGAVTLENVQFLGPQRGNLKAPLAAANVIGGVLSVSATADMAVTGSSIRYVGAAIRGAGRANVTGATAKADNLIGTYTPSGATVTAAAQQYRGKV
jgi:hypothetical protein